MKRLMLVIAAFGILVLWDGKASAEKVLTSAPSPSHLLLRNCNLFWSDASEEPVNMISVNGGDKIPVVRKMGSPKNIKIDNQFIYWIDQKDGYAGSCTGPGVVWTLNKTTLDGSSTLSLAKGSNCNWGTSDIVVDNNNIYWVNSLSSPNTYIIQKVQDGGGSSTIHSSYWIPINCLVKDDAYLYWYEGYGPDPTVTTCVIKKMPLGGGEATSVYEGQRFSKNFIVDGSEIIVAERGIPNSNSYRILKVSITGGTVTELATPTNDSWPINMVLAGTNLYWFGGVGGDTIFSMPKVGGNISTIAAEEDINNHIYSIISTGIKVFWSGTSPEGGFIRSVPVSGGIIDTLFQGGYAPVNLALNGNEMYWTESVPFTPDATGRIAKMSTFGGPDTTILMGIASSNPPIACDGNNLFIGDRWKIIKVGISSKEVRPFISSPEEIGDLTTDGSNVYWVDKYLSTVFKAPISGGPFTVLSGSLTGYSGPIRVYKGYVYWMTNFDTIKKVSVNGGEIVTVASGLPFLSDFVVDDTYIYFSENDTGYIKKISIAGGSIDTLTILNPIASPRNLSVFDGVLYWIDQQSVGMIPTTGGTPFIIDYVQADPYFPGSIAVDSTGVFWTETATGYIKKYPDQISNCPPGAKTEQWKLILNGGLGSGNCTLIEGQNGTITANGNWIYNYQGAIVLGPYSNAPVTIAGSSISITASGTAINPSALPGYQTSPFTLSISGKACNGHGSVTFTITFTTFGWPSSISGTWGGTRTSGSGITAVALPLIPLLLDD